LLTLILSFCLNVLLLFFLQKTIILIFSSTSSFMALQAHHATRLQYGPRSTLLFLCALR
jgi:hypothetical protein